MATFTLVAIHGMSMEPSYHVVEADCAAHAERLVHASLGYPECFDVVDIECVKGVPAPSPVSAYSDDEWDFGHSDEEHDAHVSVAVYHVAGMRYNEYGNPCFHMGG